MDDKISLWAEDYTYYLKCDLESLGIKAEIYDPHGIIVKFKSEEDLTFYKIAGRFKESYYLLFLGPKHNVEDVNLNTVISPSLSRSMSIREELKNGHKD